MPSKRGEPPAQAAATLGQVLHASVSDRTTHGDDIDLITRLRSSANEWAAKCAIACQERDDARAELADAAASWPKCPDGCGCRLGTQDAEPSECGCGGPCGMECLENGYPEAPSYRDLAVKAARTKACHAERELAEARASAADYAQKAATACNDRDEARDVVTEICARIRDEGYLALGDEVPGWIARAGAETPR